MAGDRLLMTSADESGNTALLAAKTEIVAAEVVSISFSYFDGFTWYPSWDSTAMAAVPRAVEVILEIAAPVTQGKSSSASGATTVYHMTVAIPPGKITLPTTE
jgi:hypothetical protein